MTDAVTVTILLTDLVGSTGLATRVGPGAADEIRKEHFGLIREALGDNGGREVKNTGDGMLCAFGSAVAAVGCAIAIQQRFERRNRDADEQLHLRIGLSTGDVTAAEDDYFGVPVVEAARLCDRAASDQILASETVALLTKGRGYEFEPIGELELKGLSDPLPTLAVNWDPIDDAADAAPLPAALRQTPPGGFIGRTAESARLAEAIERVGEGERRVVLISGEPGIGKTRLATHAAIEARSSGASVLYGRCDEDLALPYGPWVESLTGLVEHAPEATLRAHVAEHGGEAARIAPALRERIADLPPPVPTDPETDRFLLWGAVAGLLSTASERNVLVVILDDLHWADKPTLQLLKHVLADRREIRVLFIGTYRSSDIGRGHPLSELLADLNRIPGVERIGLDGIGETGIVTMMEQAAGHEIGADGRALAGDLFRETDGNPFYTAEVLRHLRESGTIVQDDAGRWAVTGELSAATLPQSVREVVGRRIERLGERAHRVLSAAAVIGRHFDVSLLAATTEEDEDELLDLLEQAVTASILAESPTVPGRFSFTHALINHTIYEDLGTTRRARAHRRIAVALEAELGNDPGERISELANHWAAAQSPADAERAIDYALRAGGRALAESAPAEGVRWFSRAAAMLDEQQDADRTVRCDVLIGLGSSQLRAGEGAFRETLLEAGTIASGLGDPARAAQAALANNRGQSSWFGRIDDERVAAIERALELQPPGGPNGDATRAQLLGLLAVELIAESDHRRHHALAEEALELARSSGDPSVIGHVVYKARLALSGPEAIGRRVALLPEAKWAAEETGDPLLAIMAAQQEADCSLETLDISAYDAAIELQAELCADVAHPYRSWVSLLNQACRSFVHGDLAAAERIADQALRAGQENDQPDAVMLYGAQIGEVRFFQDRSMEDIEIWNAAVEQNPGLTAWRAALIAVLSWLGQSEQAHGMLDEAARDGFAHVPFDQSWSLAMAFYADSAAQIGHRDAALHLYDRIAPHGDLQATNGVNAWGPLHIYLGLLATTLDRPAAADEHFARALTLIEGKRMPLWEARTRLGMAELHTRQGEHDRVRSEAARAVAVAREHDYVAIEARAAALAG